VHVSGGGWTSRDGAEGVFAYPKDLPFELKEAVDVIRKWCNANPWLDYVKAEAPPLPPSNKK
jgi:hypothetical protein